MKMSSLEMTHLAAITQPESQVHPVLQSGSLCPTGEFCPSLSVTQAGGGVRLQNVPQEIKLMKLNEIKLHEKNSRPRFKIVAHILNLCSSWRQSKVILSRTKF